MRNFLYITEIKYNHLNLPTKITWSNNKHITYQYNAAGQKISKSVRENDSIKVVEYLDGFQYAGEVLQFFPHPEGYVKVTALSAGRGLPTSDFAFNYVFNYTDHLGNVRLSYTKDPQTGLLKILDESHYYPFGLKHQEYGTYGLVESHLDVIVAPIAKNPYQYKYNGKELQDELGLNLYDYGFRNYDSALGRWMNIDLLAEKFNSDTPYAYVLNNPINGFDPDGRDVIVINDSKGANGFGHSAVIVGNSTDGWYYYSVNGTGEGAAIYGDSKNADIGTFLGTGLSAESAVKKANTINSNEQHNYDSFVAIKTTKEEDKLIKNKVKRKAGLKKYCVVGNSCITVPQKALSTLLESRGAPNRLVEDISLIIVPNNWMKSLPNSITRANTFLTTENKIEPRKEGKVSLGELEYDIIEDEELE